MTCAFDWIFNGTNFYDVWISRTLVGHTFFEVPRDGSWSYSKDLFWSDPDGRRRYEAKNPFQVYSCLGGMVTLDAPSFADDTVQVPCLGSWRVLDG
jgi:alpha-1,3-mannosyltransferase